MNPKFFNILLNPDQEQSGEPLNNAAPSEAPASPSTSEKTLEALMQDVENLKEVVRKERELKADAERKAKEAEKAASQASMTAEERVAQQLRELAESNKSLRIEAGKERHLRDALAKIDADGYEVNRESLDRLMAVAAPSITEENVGEVISTIVETLKATKAASVATPNASAPQLQTKQFKFGEIPDDALTGDYVGKAPIPKF